MNSSYDPEGTADAVSVPSTGPHTPGPWSVTPYGDGDSLVIHAGDDWRICFMATPGSSHGAFAGIKANAALIAAAPDLLDACQVAIGHMTGGMDGDWRDCDPVAVLRAAIAKATPPQRTNT